MTDAVETEKESREVNATESPASILAEVRKWPWENTFPVAIFVQEVVFRSQGTLSSLLNTPPTVIPTGAGREPWEKMRTFLASPEEQQKLLDKKNMKGKAFFRTSRYV